ncbi:MAG: PAS domain-containing protein, partial [Candidatus Jettenia caeni]|nr:PAS domain-containing protein [Candidatus Jettenia caeni]
MIGQDKKKNKELAQHTIKFFEKLLRASSDGIVITDAAHNIIVVNEAFCDFFGRQHREVIETDLFFWLEQLGTSS